jgi:hypothetical protein
VLQVLGEIMPLLREALQLLREALPLLRTLVERMPPPPEAHHQV